MNRVNTFFWSRLNPTGELVRSVDVLLRELVPPARAIVAPRDHPVAYQAYLKGRYHWAKPGDVGLRESLRCFSEAVREAPGFAAALGALGRVRVASAEYYHELPRLALWPREEEVPGVFGPRASRL